MTEASGAVVEWAFATFAMDKILARHRDGNTGSARVLSKCGFKYTGEREKMFAHHFDRDVENHWMELNRKGEGGVWDSRS